MELNKTLKELNKKIQDEKSLLLFILIIVAITVTVCILVNKHISRKIYLSKWSEYDDCGMDLL